MQIVLVLIFLSRHRSAILRSMLNRSEQFEQKFDIGKDTSVSGRQRRDCCSFVLTLWYFACNTGVPHDVEISDEARDLIADLLCGAEERLQSLVCVLLFCFSLRCSAHQTFLGGSEATLFSRRHAVDATAKTAGAVCANALVANRYMSVVCVGLLDYLLTANVL